MTRISAFVLIVLLLSACHSSKNSSRWEDPVYARPPEPPSAQHAAQGDVSDSRRAVVDAACGWIGVPYKYGGNTRSGVDCSGLVCMAFEKGAGLKLPRSSAEQAKWCKSVSQSRLQPGDLIFFTNKRGGGRINHVAIYVGDGRMVHSTSSRGVTISSLDEDYWHSHFHSCGNAGLK